MTDWKDFSSRITLAGLILLVITGTALLFWYTLDVILIIFFGLLLAILYNGLCKGLNKRIPIGRTSWLIILVTLSIIGPAAMFWYYGSILVNQANQLVNSLGHAGNELLMQYDFARDLFDDFKTSFNQLSKLDILTNISGFFSTTLGYVFNILIIFFVGIYVAFEPQTYVNGLLQLFPKSYQSRIREILGALDHMLLWWIAGRLLSMVIIGTLTVIGLLLLGIPLPFTLGALAALLEFIPYLGPILSAIPAILIALTVSPTTALYVALLYFAIQQLEGYLFTPIIQEETISLPPAFTVATQIIFSLLAGGIGLIMAQPFTAMIVLFVQTFYVQDVLHNDVKLLGEH